MRRSLLRLLVISLALVLGLTGWFAAPASGDNEVTVDQSGSSRSADVVAGQVVGVVSAGDTSVSAANRTEDARATTGDASVVNRAEATSTTGSGGDAQTRVRQSNDATSGDALAGQVIGVVTPAGGTADLVVDNTSIGIRISSGDSRAHSATVVTLIVV